MAKVEFLRTGDFWIDFGIVSMWDRFATSLGHDVVMKRDYWKLDSRKVTVALDVDSLTLEGDERSITELLQEAVDDLRKFAWGKTKSGKMWWNGAAAFFFRQQNKPSSFLVTPNALVKKKARKTGVCDFCGREVKGIMEARASEFPLIVRSDKMSSFYSQLRGSVKICVYCAFVSWFVVARIFFNIRGNMLNGFVFESDDFMKLVKAFRLLSKLYATAQPYKNFDGSLRNTEYPLETFMGFLLNLHRKIEKRSSLMEQLGLAHIFSARQEGNVVAFERYYALPNLPKVLDVISLMEWKTEKAQHNALQDILSEFHFTIGRKPDTVIREELSRRLLNMSEICDVIEEFLARRVLTERYPMSTFSSISFYLLLERYETGVLRLDTNLLNTAREVGELIGQLAAEKEDKSFLYALRSVRTLDELLANLHQFLTRYMGEIGGRGEPIKRLLSPIDDMNWKKFKSLIGIYAILKYASPKK